MNSHDGRYHAVVIAGAGPTGLMLAGELALRKVDVAIVERRATQELRGSLGCLSELPVSGRSTFDHTMRIRRRVGAYR